MKKLRNVIGLFDGMSCGQIALIENKIRFEQYYASEIDRFAMHQTQTNFPGTVQLGDVNNWLMWDVDWKRVDLILAGSPCQGFSFAGKQLAFDDPRSSLFFTFIDILRYAQRQNPNVRFLLENVNMKTEHLRIITDHVGVHPVRINSNLVSAQNRDRWYWTNIGRMKEDLFGGLHSSIPQPEDEGVFLRDILEVEVDEKYYIKKPKFNFDGMNINGKCRTLRTGGKSTQSNKHNYDIIKLDTKGNKRRNQDKFSCITGASGHGAGNHSDMDLICISSKQSNATVSVNKSTPMVAAMGMGGGHVPMVCVAQRGRNSDNPKSRKAGLPTVQMLETNMSGKSNALTTVQKDNLILQRPRGNNQGGVFEGKAPTVSRNAWEQNNLVCQLNPSLESGGKQPYQQNRVYADYGKSPAHMAQLSCGAYAVETKSRIRRLTPTEVARLQTIPAWYMWDVSDTQIYKMCGNGWTVKVIKYILNYI